MNKFLRFHFERGLGFAAVFFSAAAIAGATPPSSPEPADYALGFGAASLAFIVWRNVRRARGRKSGA